MIRRFKAYLFLWVLVGVVLTPSAGAQTSSLEDVRREAEITGWSIVAIENGEVSDSYSGGTRSSETNPPVTEATVFDAESLTKPITAYIALKLAGEGVLDLDKPLAEYAAYPDAASDSRYLKITARMVLNHTAGFPNWRNGAETLPVLFEPGQLFSYSGEGYVFLQHTLERITLKTLEDLGKIHVFEPFEMTSTSFVWQTAFQSKIAVGSGGIFGKGFLKGTQSYLEFLPEKHTDFIFTLFSEEFGFVGSFILLLIYTIIIYRIVAIGASSRSYFGKIFCYSFGAAIFVYITINMSMVLGLLPIVGSPLPIMSYGGSSMLATMIGFGIVMSARVHNQQSIA